MFWYCTFIIGVDMNEHELYRLMSIEPAVIEDQEWFAISYTDESGKKVLKEHFLSKSLMVWIIELMIKYGTKDVQLWRWCWAGQQWHEEGMT